MISPILMTKVICNHKDHQNELISTICTRPQCQANSACCLKCISSQFHLDCGRNITHFDQVPELVGKIQNLETVYQSLASKVDQIIKQIKKAFDVLLQPISNYQKTPNLGNLNSLGELLRHNTYDSIIQSIDQFQIGIDDQFYKLLKALSEPTKNQEEEADKLFEEAQRFFGVDDQQSINLIEKAIILVHNNEIYWYEKGCCLQRLRRFDEAIESFNQSISIKPNVDAYRFKANSLISQKKIIDAINCHKEGLLIFPNSKILQVQLTSIQARLNRQN